MTLRLLAAYLVIVLGPLFVVAAAFAVRDLFAARRPGHPRGNGHAEIEGLEHTVEEARAP